MIKLLCSILIVSLCGAIGYVAGKYFSKKVRKKYDFYCDLVSYTLQLKNNICGKQQELFQFNQDFCNTSSAVFANYLLHDKCEFKLEPAEKKNLTTFFASLKEGTKESLVELLDYNKQLFENQCNNTVKNQLDNSSVYCKICLLFGLMLGILLV